MDDGRYFESPNVPIHDVYAVEPDGLRHRLKEINMEKILQQHWNSAIDKAVEAIHKVIEDTGIPQDFDMNDLLDIEHDIEEELKKLKEVR